MALSEFLVLFATLLLVAYIWQKWNYRYWQRHNVKYVKPTPFFGNLKEMFKIQSSFSDCVWELYKTPGFEREPLVGIYTALRPAILLRDLELIKRIMIKDFNTFANRFLKADPVHDPLGNNNLFLVRTPFWREIRTKISPVFTSGKVKHMYPLIAEVSKDLNKHLASITDKSAVDVKDICARLTTDTIGTIAFGIRANSLLNPKSDFYKHSISIFALTFRRGIEITLTFLWPTLTALFRIKTFTKSASAFLSKTLLSVMEEREKSGVVRNDLIDILIGLKRSAQPEKLSYLADNDFLVAQAAIFQTAGFETSSSTMSFALYELAKQPQLQDRLRAEIKQAFEDGDGAISYEDIQSMKYLGQVIDETLRLYPILALLERECQPVDGTDGYSLKPYSDFVVPRGMPIYISLIALQRDEKYWPEPQKFDPERFAPENRDNINWDAYMPFGAGPRICIGMRIGLLQAKFGLVHFLKNHRVATCEKTSKSIDFDARCFVLSNKEGIHLKLERVE